MILLHRVLLAFVFSFLVLVASSDAYATCADPEGNEGEITYNTTYKTMQFCDGSKWWSMKGSITGDSLASKDFVNAAVAAGTSGNYSAPTQYMFTTVAKSGDQADDACEDETSDGGGWHLGNTRDLYFFNLRGKFPRPSSGAAWIHITSQPEILIATGNTGNSYSAHYAGSYGFRAETTTSSSWQNCYGWSASSGPYGGVLNSSYYVYQQGCNSQSFSFCVK